MPVAWTQHRFAGGLLALDTANTVVLRGDAARTFDRFDDTTEIARFAEAASVFRAEELGGCRLQAADPHGIRDVVIDIREAIDSLFRGVANAAAPEPGHMSWFLRACAAGLQHFGADARLTFPASSAVPFEAALSISALSLLRARNNARLKTCANCGWLFIDRSRNSSRMWCDMKVCGNRQKAKRHYHRSRSGGFADV